MDGSFLFKAAVSCAEKQCVGFQDLGTGTPGWDASLINVINYTCAFPAITCKYF